jgi:hypothetical protein
MILVYSDSHMIDDQWLPALNFAHEYQVCHNIDHYISTPAAIKIAFTTDRFQNDYDPSPKYPRPGYEQKINLLKLSSNLVFAADTELHPFHRNIWKQCHDKNVYWIIPGALNNNSIVDSEHTIGWPWWLGSMVYLYTHLSHKLTEIQPQLPKEKYFDALLGRSRPHRDFIYSSVKSAQLDHKITMTYQQNQSSEGLKKFFDTEFIWESGCDPIEELAGTHSTVNYQGFTDGLSRIIPIELYNQTAYSIVAETSAENDLLFFTEKIVKPILARRLFVVFAGQGFLAALRRLGFQTFENIIDESYDSVYNNNDRYQAAFDQVQRLCSMDQAQVYEQIKDRLEYNHNLLMTTSWDRVMFNQIQQKLDQCIIQNLTTTN